VKVMLNLYLASTVIVLVQSFRGIFLSRGVVWDGGINEVKHELGGNAELRINTLS